MLADSVVADLTAGPGQMAGQLLAQVGARVYLVEPPEGSPARRHGLGWSAFGRGKRSIVIDPTSANGRAEIFGVLRGADIIVHDHPPGSPALHTLSDAELGELNPSAIRVYITPFGMDGPKAQRAATDLTIAAASGQMALSGDERHPPLRIPVPQVMHNAAAEAAMGALVALEARRRTGRGQRVDVSAQQAMLACTQSTCLAAAVNASTYRRCGDGSIQPPIRVRMMFPAADGWVSITHAFGDAVGPFTNRLMRWIESCGECPADLVGEDWVTFGAKLLADPAVLARFERAKDVIAEFTSRRTRNDLFAAAVERRLLLAPVNEVGEVLDHPHLRARGFWDDTASNDARLMPGPFASVSPTPLRRHLTCPALNEHRGELPALVAAQQHAPADAGGPTAAALGGLHVVDFSWAVAGPSIGRMLADFGATVVRIEATGHFDLVRGAGPFVDDVVGVERSAQYHNLNAGKLGVALDLRNPRAHDAVLRLIDRADAVCESFAPGVMDRLGLGWEVLHKRNPRLVMLSSSLFGQSGPLTTFAGFGNLSTAMSGFSHVNGWPDSGPISPYGAYLDYLSPRLGQIALLAALGHARRTGEGQLVDVSQMEVATQFLAERLIERQVTGRERPRMGNDDDVMVPHGVYACRGRAEAIATGEDDSPYWLAVAVRDDDDWRAVCRVVGGKLRGAAMVERKVEGRRAARREIDDELSRWCSEHDVVAAEELLVGAGIPTHRVQNSPQLIVDPQLRHRGHWVRVPVPGLESITVEGARALLSETAGEPRSGGPALGQHVVEVLQGLAGLNDEELTELIATGGLG
jgi:crotonobetainyl-CoA:carnitine CoA-transferase CaiB-like acyl-CoA transferase